MNIGNNRSTRQEAVTVNVNPLIETTVKALAGLKPQSQELVAILVRQLAGQEGVDMASSAAPGLQIPADGVPLWLAKLKQESYSRRTIEVYLSTVRNYLEIDPTPTKLSIQMWLAERLEQVSSAQAATDRKALRSLFSFLHEEGLWPFDPTARLKSIRVRYRARECPEMEDVRKLLTYECYRGENTDKFRTMTVVLMTTGLRVSEAASIHKAGISFTNHEIKIIGKGDKEGVVPMLPMTEEFLRRYLAGHENGGQFLFPGDTELGYWSVSSYGKTLKRACDKLGIKRMTPHQLRHFFATYALRGGAKLEVISKILRHASVAITADIYRHVLPDEIHETAKLFAPFSDEPLRITETASKEAE